MILSRLVAGVFLLSLLHISLISQLNDGSISGKVTDKKTSQPVESVDIKLYKSSDSSFVKGLSTDPDGRFIIENLSYGNYFLSASIVGYSSAVIRGIILTKDNPKFSAEIKLSVGETVTDEILVESEKSLVELKADRKVFNVAQNPVSQSGSLIDLLKELPSISVDQDGNVSFRGSEAVKIMIDGKPLGMEGEGRNSVLRQIPANSVESIEFITNPSAKFEAEGSSGIINIILKKGTRTQFGYNGSIGLNLGTGDKYTGLTSFSLKTDKLRFSVNYNYNLLNTEPVGFNDRKSLVYNTFSDINNSGTARNKSHLFRAQVDYSIDPKNLLGLSFTFQKGDNVSKDNSIYKIYDSGNNIISDYTFISENTSSNSPLDAGLTYKRTFKNPKNTLSAELNYSYNKEKNNYLNSYEYRLPNITEPPLNKIIQDESSNDLTGQLDYVQPLGKNGKLETGIRSSVKKREIDYISEMYDYSSGNFVNDTGQTNSYQYNESVQGIYGVYYDEFGKIGVSVGLRGEYTLSDGKLINNNSEFTKKYFDIFPSLSLSYKISKTSQVQFSYSRRINRPRPGQLNPFMAVRGANNFFTGNPDLNAEYTNSFEINYIHFLPFMTVTPGIYYKHTTDEISRTRTLVDSAKTVVSFANYGTVKSYGGELIINANPFRFINLNGTFSISRREVDATNVSSTFRNSGTVWSTRFMANLNLPLDFGFQISYFYSGKRINAQGFIEPFQSLDASLKKDFFDKRLTLSLLVRDILDKSRFRGEFNDVSYTEVFERRRDKRTVFFNITYNFGQKDKSENTRRREDNRRRDDEGDF
ncbi:MAG: TonB-dependent receptor [Ignavibacteria bacterium]|nr:TonB-dependent receptor [Ignavibacteria bacterium]